MTDRMLITCEHGGNRVPSRYAKWFQGRQKLLSSHRGYDRGALELARRLARRVRAPLVATQTTRLLVDQNRSPDHPALFSSVSASLPGQLRSEILKRHYLPARRTVEDLLARWAGQGDRIFHLSVHSFTPVLRGIRRHADVGLLYDPSRKWAQSTAGGENGEEFAERTWADRLQKAIARRLPRLRVRRNYPYRGTSDGLTTFLRHRFPQYAGIELEINQRLVRGRSWDRLQALLVEAIAEASPCPDERSR